MARPRLISLLDEAAHVPLILVSAPAGTGKTSLVSDWVRTRGEPARTAWITLEPGEQAVWPSIVEGLQQAGVSVRHGAFPDHVAPVDRRALVALAGELARLPEPVRLVVDGYELVSPEVASDVDFLLRHSGRRLRLVMVTRVDPVLPLYRYRLDDTAAEVRMADLAFTDDEASRLLARSGVRISPDSVRLLNSRLEGWAVGLRFASRILSLREDADVGVDEVVGYRGNIGEYLLGEVLDAQPAEVRQLLLSTSIPDILRPGLAEELGGPSASRTLDLLTRSNAFLEPVPQHPGAFRYHPLFRELLRAELAYESPDLLEQLQRKAAEWFADHGLLDESVSHYAAIDAWTDAAAEVVNDLAVGQLLLNPQASALARTLEAIPHRVDDAAVHVVRAALALGAGEMALFAEQVDLARACLRVGGGRHDRAVSLALDVLQAVRSRDLDDPDAALTLVADAERALDARDHRAKAANHPELKAMVLASRGSARARQGLVTEAYEAFAAAASAAGGRGAESLLCDCLGQMAVLACFRGQVAHADSLASRAVTVADSVGIPVERRSPSAASAQAWVNAERNDVRQAVRSVEVAERSASVGDDPVARTLLTVAKARVRAAQGDVPGALSEVEGASVELADPNGWLRDRLGIERGHLRVRTGDAVAALLDVEDIRADGDAEVALLVARARLQQGDDEATADSLAAALSKNAPLSTQVQAWLVEAARQLSGGSRAHARSALRKSLRLAARETVRRPFREAEVAVRDLLARDAQLQAQNPWLGGEQSRTVRGRLLPDVAAGHPAVPDQRRPPVVESLTAKELEVLGHLAELLTTEEIAGTMFVSVNTIRTHVRSILRKLGVSRRNAAVRRARELDLLPG